MKLFGRNHLIMSAITFGILFAMNYVGNTSPDKLEGALMTAGAGVIGLTLGLLIYNKGKGGDNTPQNFD